MPIRDSIVGLLLLAEDAPADSIFHITSPTDELFGAVASIDLPSKTLRRNTQNDVAGVVRRGVVLGLEEMRLTGTLRIWNPQFYTIFGSNKVGSRSADETITEGENAPTTFTIRMATEGYQFQNARASRIKFRGFWDEFGGVTIGADTEEIAVPFGVDLTYYAEFYSPDNNPSNEKEMFVYDATNVQLLVRRKYDDNDMQNLWAERTGNLLGTESRI